jgi:hypothetical protein
MAARVGIPLSEKASLLLALKNLAGLETDVGGNV